MDVFKVTILLNIIVWTIVVLQKIKLRKQNKTLKELKQDENR